MRQVSEFHSVQPLVAQLLWTQSIQARQQHPALRQGYKVKNRPLSHKGGNFSFFPK